jgi:DNA invertase Pin-like site-specific DNA recombinase
MEEIKKSYGYSLMLIGYRRILLHSPSIEEQLLAIVAAKCDRIATDIVPSLNAEQPVLARIIPLLQPGDVLVVWRLDQLGKPAKQLLEWLIQLMDSGIHLYSLEDQLDTRRYDTQAIRQMLRALLHNEQRVMQDRTQAGLQQAKTQKRSAQPSTSLTPKQIEIGKQLAADPTQTVDSICRILKISRSTYYRLIHPKE